MPLNLDSSSNWVAGTADRARTPRYTQTDLSVFQDFHVSKSNERLVARVGADCINCFNQHSVTVINSNMIAHRRHQPATVRHGGRHLLDGDGRERRLQLRLGPAKGYDYLGLANSQNRILSNLYGKATKLADPALPAVPGQVHILITPPRRT